MQKKHIKWFLLSAFILTGVWAAAIAPSAVENMLPEAETIRIEKQVYTPVVKGNGIIYKAEDNYFYIKTAVRESDINAVQISQPAKLYGAAIGDGQYTAEVTEIASTAYQREFGGVQETVVDVVLQIVNHDEFIRSGYTAEAIISVLPERSILLAPYETINQDDRGEFVLVLRGNTAVRKDIVTGAELITGAEVITGLTENDELIINPEKYSENALIKAIN
ncbi:MAG: hypothetical protein FWG44_05225 [Oscillospiraceae bacterium]|nr:hypothetical protein [Oscillospiraceae bacterium]